LADLNTSFHYFIPFIPPLACMLIKLCIATQMEILHQKRVR